MVSDMAKHKRFLAVDQGNSNIKLTLISEDGTEELRFHSDACEDVFAAVDRFRPDCGAFCSVCHMDPRMVESLRLALDGRLLVMSHSTPLPLEFEYSTFSTLGLDRMALAVGASYIYEKEAVAVVDAGTAVTIDIVDSHSVFRGGRISPGIALRFDALHRHTDALPLVGSDGESPLAGISTETSIRSGVILGLADELTETFRQYSKTFGCTRLVLTGGDAPLLERCISSRIPVCNRPDLLAQGLLHIYNYNEIKD